MGDLSDAIRNTTAVAAMRQALADYEAAKDGPDRFAAWAERNAPPQYRGFLDTALNFRDARDQQPADSASWQQFNTQMIRYLDLFADVLRHWGGE